MKQTIITCAAQKLLGTVDAAMEQAGIEAQHRQTLDAYDDVMNKWALGLLEDFSDAVRGEIASKFVRLADHYESLSRLYEAGDVRANILADVAKQLRETI